MGNRLPPIVGNWYAHRDKGALFQVVALDEDAGTVEIQEFDGGLVLSYPSALTDRLVVTGD